MHRTGRLLASIPRPALWIAVVAWMGVIFRLSALHGSDVPGRFSTLGHFGVYAILGFLLFLAIDSPRVRGHALLAAVLIASVYGVTDEYHQSFVPERVPEVIDWVVDTLGAAAGALIASRITRWTRTRENAASAQHD